MPDAPRQEDYYALLNVDPEASQDEIRAAYRNMARDFHPDRLAGASNEARRWAEEKLIAINAAYEALGDPLKRQQYHARWLLRNSPPQPVVEPDSLDFREFIAGQRQTSFFIINNAGGPYRTISVSNPDSWVQVTGYTSLSDSDELPLRVEVEAVGEDWGKSYTDSITVKLDDVTIQVPVNLATRPEHRPPTPRPSAKPNPFRQSNYPQQRGNPADVFQTAKNIPEFPYLLVGGSGGFTLGAILGGALGWHGGGGLFLIGPLIAVICWSLYNYVKGNDLFDIIFGGIIGGAFGGVLLGALPSMLVICVDGCPEQISGVFAGIVAGMILGALNGGVAGLSLELQ